MSGVPGLIRALIPPPAPVGAQGQAPLDAAQLRSLLDVGDVLMVKVLGQLVGRSTIEIAGRPADAALPEGVVPGDLLQVRVEGFSSDQVLLKLLTRVPAPESRPEPAAPTPTPPDRLPVGDAPATPEPQAGQPPPSGAAPPLVLARPQAASAALEGAVAEASDLPARLAAFRLSTAAGASAPSRPAGPLPAPASTPAAFPAQAPVRAGAPGTISARLASAPVPAPRAAAAPSAPGVAILRALRIPVTPTTLAAARIALEGSASVASALEGLQRALPLASQDPRVHQLRALAEFVGTLDPAMPELLPTRIEAYVGHVLGQEANLQALLATPTPPDTPTTAAQAGSPPTQAGSPPAQSGSPPAQSGSPPAQAGPASAGSLESVEIAAARVVVAAASVAANLKTQVMALLASGTVEGAGRAALQTTLTAINAAQIQTLSLQTAGSQSIVVPLPLPFPAGGQQAYLRVERDGRNGAAPLTAESFRLALVLETAHHGTVAVDLLCAERSLSVEVKTERSNAAAAFQRGLPELGSRLERLSYRVVRLGAAVAPVGAIAEPTAPAVASQAGEAPSALDLRA